MASGGYSVWDERLRSGVLRVIRGCVPVSDLGALLGCWAREGDLVSSDRLNARLEATLVVGEARVIAEAEALGDALRGRFSAVEGRAVSISCPGGAA